MAPLPGRERLLFAAALAVVALIGLAGAALAAVARDQVEARRALDARREIASWLLPIEEFRTDNGSYAGMSLALLGRYGVSTDWTGAKLRFVGRDGYCIERDTPPVFSRAGSLAPIVRGPCTRARTRAAPAAHDGDAPDLPAVGEILAAARPAWAKEGPWETAWVLAEMFRTPPEGYWLANSGSYAGVSLTALDQMFGASRVSAGWPARVAIVSPERKSACATLTFRTATVSLREPGARISPGGCV